jgi:pimeloyl-ACP methyl ester carboxylesterase
MITALADGRLLAEKTGATPPAVVALPGWMRSATDFTPIVDGLDAVAIHFPGFGTTPEPRTVWGSEDYAGDLAAAIAGFGPVILVAHSFGGRVAVRLAAKYPQYVKGIVLTGVPLLRLQAAPKPALSFRIVRSLAKKGILPASVLEKQRQKRGSADYLAAQGTMRDVLVRVVGEEYGDDLARITVPVRMVWGENDTAAPADAGLAASQLIAGSTFRAVPGAGHLLDGDLRTAVREELLAIIAQTAPQKEQGK